MILVLLGPEIVWQVLVVKFSIPIFETRPLLAVESFPSDPSAEPVAIPTRDGLSLAGSLLRTQRDTPRGIILFCHEFDSSRWSALPYCEGLLAAGFHVLTFDFRNHGDSESMPGYVPTHWATVLETEDARAALEFIAGRPDLRGLPLGIFGISRGGGTALVAASQSDLVQCVATDGAYACIEMLLHYTNRWGRLYFPEWILRRLPGWHVQFSLWLIRTASEFRTGCKYANVERALSRLRAKPVMMISGERDSYVFPEITRSLFARTRQDPSGLWIVPRARHNKAREQSPGEYDHRLAEFFSGLDSSRPDSHAGNGRLAVGGPAQPLSQPGAANFSSSLAPSS